MKRLIVSLIPVVILALALAGCASTSQENAGVEDTEMPQEETSVAVLETSTTEVTEEPSTAMTEESNAVTEEPGLEPSEEMETITEEAQADQGEPPTAETTESAQAGVTADEAAVIPPTGAVNLSRISNLLDFEVWNYSNEQIGAVNAIVINKDNSRIEYVIVGSGGFLGLGETEIPVPWQVIQLEGDVMIEAEGNAQSEKTQAAETPQNVFILNITEQDLEYVPEFNLTPLYEPQETAVEGETAETMSLDQLEQKIRAFWQSEPMTQASGPKNLVLADNLRYAPLQPEDAGLSDQPSADQQGATDQLGDTTQQGPRQPLGQVEEIMVDANTGQVTYLLVSLNTAPGVQEPPTGGVEAPTVGDAQETVTGDVPLATIQIVPVPLDAVEWNAEEATLVYTGSESLMEAPTISFDQIENDSSNWKSQADSFWGLESNDAEMQDTENQ